MCLYSDSCSVCHGITHACASTFWLNMHLHLVASLVLLFCIHLVVMETDNKRALRSSGSTDELASDKRLKLVKELVRHSGASRTTLTKVLQSLQDLGMLRGICDTTSMSSHLRSVRAAIENDAVHAITPYGKLFRSIDLPIYDPDQRHADELHFVHPMALLHFLCDCNASLFGIVKAAADRCDGRLRIVLYIDEINPGNPLAPDPNQMLQAVYWCIPELPFWFLRRKDSWWIFCLVRTKTVKRLDGEITELLKLILHTFYSHHPADDSFAKACYVKNDSSSVVITCEFGGVLADEKGLKEALGIMGQAGNDPCFSCLNIRNRWVNCSGPGGLQKFWDPAVEDRKPCTDDHVNAIVGRLRTASTGGRTALKKLQTDHQKVVQKGGQNGAKSTHK